MTVSNHERTNEHLDHFSRISNSAPYDYRWCHHHDGGESDYHVVIGSIVHGNEVGSLPSIIQAVEGLKSGDVQFGGKLTIFLGNPEASLQNRRFLDVDLNRVFVDTPPDSHEGRRAEEIKPILDSADIFLDLHQTMADTDRAFYIFPYFTEGWHWARALGATETWVTRPSTATFSQGSVCADEYVRNRGYPGLTLELSHLGYYPTVDVLVSNVIDRLLHLTTLVDNESSTIEALALEQPDLIFKQMTWSHPFDSPQMRLRPSLRNFDPVHEGDDLSDAGSPPIMVPLDGQLLFPKYVDNVAGADLTADQLPSEIVRVIQNLDEHPSEIWPG